MAVIRMGTLGALLTAAQNMHSSMPLSGDAEIGWIPPLDPDAPIRHATLPLSRMSGTSGRIYEARIGYIIDRAGTVQAINTGNPDRCPAPLLDEAGVTQALGGCAEDPSVGVVLDDRILLLHAGPAVQVISSAMRPPAIPRKAPAVPIALRELRRTAISPNARRFTFGAGLRKGVPVAIAVDTAGHARLSPIDPENGTPGPEETLASLAELIPATDPRCARMEAARVVLPLKTEIGLAPGSVPGVLASGSFALAVIRWSKEAACLEAVEVSVRDERHENDVSSYEPWGTFRKVIARFEPGKSGRSNQDGQGANASLVVVQPGTEIRQRLRCDQIAR
jgi:hypothetical protein